MRLDEVDGSPRVRFRLNAAMGLDGDIEEIMVYVLDINQGVVARGVKAVAKSNFMFLQPEFVKEFDCL